MRHLPFGSLGEPCVRTELVRQALAEFIARRETEERETRERAILAHHKKKLARQARALLDEQAEP